MQSSVAMLDYKLATGVTSRRLASLLGGKERIHEEDSATETSSDDNGIDSDSDDEDENRDLDDLYDRVTRGEIDLDTIMVSSTHAEKSTGVDPAHTLVQDLEN
jgi:hypothetical protein